MTRHIALGNQEVLINFDDTLCIRDVYFPHVGQENHVLGHRQRIGVYTNHLSWIDEPNWNRCLNCEKNTLISNASLHNPNQQVELSFRSFVSLHNNVLIRRIRVHNMSDENRRITLFFHHNFQLYGDGIGDTTGYDPIRKTVFAYKRKRYIMIAAATHDELTQKKSSITSYTVGQKSENVWKDAEDGHLSENAIAQGDVESCAAKAVDVPAGKHTEVWFWMSMGQSFAEVHKIHDLVLSDHPSTMLKKTEESTDEFVKTTLTHFADLSTTIQELYERSLLVVRTQIDHDGAILAANDSDNMVFNRDTYSYLWPRDGALVAIALDRAGKRDLTEKYYRFSSKLLYEDGCFLHKYNPDGSLGSSWQAWIRNGKPYLPIQEDETGLMLHSLWVHHQQYKDQAELYEELYDSFIVPAANFLESWWDSDLGVIKESWDLWEERINVSAWTSAATWAGLIAAAKFAHLKDDVREAAYLSRANDIKRSVETHLFSKEMGRFLSSLTIEDGKFNKELSIESSMMGLFMFGMFDVTDPRIEKTMQDLEKALWVPTAIGGIARNEHDYYHYKGDGFQTVKGNPWIITVCWLAKYKAAKATSMQELQEAHKLINWVHERQLATGLLPEQVHPFTGDPLSVCPLTWSHAEFIDTVHWYVEAFDRLQ